MEGGREGAWGGCVVTVTLSSVVWSGVHNSPYWPHKLSPVVDTVVLQAA